MSSLLVTIVKRGSVPDGLPSGQPFPNPVNPVVALFAFRPDQVGDSSLSWLHVSVLGPHAGVLSLYILGVPSDLHKDSFLKGLLVFSTLSSI